MNWKILVTDWKIHQDVSVHVGKISSVFCSTGEFPSGFLKAIITGNLFVAFFTDCQGSRDSAHDVTVAERRDGADRSSRNKMTIYIYIYIYI